MICYRERHRAPRTGPKMLGLSQQTLKGMHADCSCCELANSRREPSLNVIFPTISKLCAPIPRGNSCDQELGKGAIKH